MLGGGKGLANQEKTDVFAQGKIPAWRGRGLYLLEEGGRLKRDQPFNTGLQKGSLAGKIVRIEKEGEKKGFPFLKKGGAHRVGKGISVLHLERDLKKPYLTKREKLHRKRNLVKYSSKRRCSNRTALEKPAQGKPTTDFIIDGRKKKKRGATIGCAITKEKRGEGKLDAKRRKGQDMFSTHEEKKGLRRS